MIRNPTHPLATNYLRRLRRAGRQLPPERLRELMAEIEAHLHQAIPPGATDREALEALGRLGSAHDIVEAERPAEQTVGKRGWRERAAVILLPFGGFAAGVGWAVGLILLWRSRLWTTREKLIGTLIAPGGIATFIPLALLTATKRYCRTFDPLAGALAGRVGTSCTPAGTSAVTITLRIVLAVIFVVGPLVSALYLARRARVRSRFLTSLTTP